MAGEDLTLQLRSRPERHRHQALTAELRGNLSPTSSTAVNPVVITPVVANRCGRGVDEDAARYDDNLPGVLPMSTLLANADSLSYSWQR